MADKISTKLIPRREFASRAVFASVLASLAPSQLLATDTPTNAEQEQTHPNLPKLSAESQAEAEARLQNILSQYGSRFSDEQKADLRRLCIVAQPPLERLRAYKVKNGDDPALYLKPLVEREKKLPAQPVGRANTNAHQKP